MNKLLVSDFARMKKSLIFWVCAFAMLASGIIMPLALYSEKKSNGQLDSACAENTVFGFNLIAGIMCAVFCSVFQSEEYSEGTIRNKLIIGHSRRDIYLSQTFISFVASVIMCLAYILPSLIIGISLFGGFKELNSAEIVFYYLTGIMVVAVCTSLFSLVSVCVQRRAGSTVLCFLIVLIVIYISMMIYQTLNTPEYTFRIINNEPAYTLNPVYPDEKERMLLEGIFDILPSGQAYQLCYRYADNTFHMIICDIIITVFLMFSGVIFFRKKDLK